MTHVYVVKTNEDKLIAIFKNKGAAIKEAKRWTELHKNLIKPLWYEVYKMVLMDSMASKIPMCEEVKEENNE